MAAELEEFEERMQNVSELVNKISYFEENTEEYDSKVIDDIISDRLKEIFEKIAPSYNITLEEWNHDTDHVHIMFRAQPKTQMSKFINAYKSASSRLIKKEFPEIRNKLWESQFWSRSFCLISTGGATIDVIKTYIESQGEKNDPKSVPI